MEKLPFPFWEKIKQDEGDNVTQIPLYLPLPQDKYPEEKEEEAKKDGGVIIIDM